MAVASRNVCITFCLLRQQSFKNQTESLRSVSRKTSFGFLASDRDSREQRRWKPLPVAGLNNVISSNYSVIETKASSFLRQNSLTSLPDACHCKRWCSSVKSETNENDIDDLNLKVKVDQEQAANVTTVGIASVIGKDNIGQIEAKMAIQYTCKVCNGKNTNMFSKVAYTKGLVIVTCQHCKNRHLIADNLGWFKNTNHKNIEEMLKANGEVVRRITDSDEALEVLAVLDSDQAKS